jgi:putative beta-lysine N-acetyltransferase
MYDRLDRLGETVFQHGPYNGRIYVMRTGRRDLPELLPYLANLATRRGYAKVIAKCPEGCAADFESWGARREGQIPHYYGLGRDAFFMARYFDEERAAEQRPELVAENLAKARAKAAEPPSSHGEGWDHAVQPAGPEDVEEMGRVYRAVFPTYPFPIYDPAYLLQAMQNDIAFFKLTRDGAIGALASSEMDLENQAVEMTDFATLPEFRGQGAAQSLLAVMEEAMREQGLRTTFTIARAYSAGMNITFAKHGYQFGGTLTSNTNISGKIESMNIWSKPLRESG